MGQMWKIFTNSETKSGILHDYNKDKDMFIREYRVWNFDSRQHLAIKMFL